MTDLAATLSSWTQSILTALGDEPPMVRRGVRQIETAQRFLWISGAEAAAVRLIEQIGEAADHDEFCAEYLTIYGCRSDEGFAAAAARMSPSARQQGAKFLRDFVTQFSARS